MKIRTNKNRNLISTNLTINKLKLLI